MRAVIRGRDSWTGSSLPRPARFPLGAIIAAMLLSGCANVLQGDGAGGSPPNPPPHDHMNGADEVLVSITSGGGFVPVEYNLRNLPQFLLLGDGTAIVSGITIAIYPGPAIAPLQSTRLNEGQIQVLLSGADAAGLLGDEIDFGEPGVTDMNTTTVRITVGGTTVVQSAYALGFDDKNSPELSQTQKDARLALQGFVDTAQGLVGSASKGYEPNAVVAYRLGAEAGQPVDEPELEQPPMAWPLSTAPELPLDTEIASCLAVTGADVPVLLEALSTANELTPWVIGTDPPSRMVFRPFLPGDLGCE